MPKGSGGLKQDRGCTADFPYLEKRIEVVWISDARSIVCL